MKDRVRMIRDLMGLDEEPKEDDIFFKGINLSLEEQPQEQPQEVIPMNDWTFHSVKVDE